MKQDIVRVLRLIQYEGPREVIEKTVGTSVQGTKRIMTQHGEMRITGVTLDQFPEILRRAEKDVHE